MVTAKKMSKTDQLLEQVRTAGSKMTLSDQINLTARLAVPAMFAQISHILMEYIDASMVGHLGETASASIGLVATTTWLFWGLCGALSTGFSVQVAHRIGANDSEGARSVLRQAIVCCLALSSLFGVVGVSISHRLPLWLGGSYDICADASSYFMIFGFSLPVFAMGFMMTAMLRCVGQVKLASTLNIMMCVLDVVFNFFFIFPSSERELFGIPFTMYGAGMGVTGAAFGSLVAGLVTCSILFYFLCFRSPHLALFGRRRHERSDMASFRPTPRVVKKALKIGMPIGFERFIMCGAQITTTMIVAPLGKAAIAANAFGVTAESLCYMPGFGIGDAATTLVGQSVGAKRTDFVRRFANITVVMGVIIMTLMGAVMYIAAPGMMGLLTPVDEIISMGTDALRIEAFAEPLYAASIVCYGVFVGAGDTLIPSCMNLGSIWAFRITLAIILAPMMGLNGVWLAMCIELCLRGELFLLRLKSSRWIPKGIR